MMWENLKEMNAERSEKNPRVLETKLKKKLLLVGWD
jgi:hypothetical protein